MSTNEDNQQQQQEEETPCPNCGMLEKHWLDTGPNEGMDFLNAIMGLPKQYPDGGFWTCPKLYDPVTKERIDGL